MKKGELVVQDVNIESVIAQAVEKGTPVDVMERLLAMRTQIKQERAKEAFDRSMARFQAECPVIKKTKEVMSNGRLLYKYAPIESIVSQVKDAVQNNGFSYSTDMEMGDKTVTVFVTVVHAEGYSQTKKMTVPLGTKTSAMSDTQVTAAATTFAKRYAFCNAFGILTGDEDTDAAPMKEPMEPYQVARVVAEEDDEAQGKRTGKYAHKEIEYPKMNETNDAHGLTDDKKSTIKRLLDEKFNIRPDTQAAARVDIKLLTGKLWFVGQNDSDILEALQKTEPKKK